MGLLDNTTPQEYYDGNDFGNYQFTSLDDIINYFQIAYVGEGKIIKKIKRADIAFHAQRALQELSFDTLKSFKAQEIIVPASLQMILPQDYINYTKISTVDSAGIKHLLYPTSKTSNPFNPYQDENGKFELRFSVLITGGSSNVLVDLEDINNTSDWKNISSDVIPGMKCFFGDDNTTPYFIKTVERSNIATNIILQDANGVDYVAPDINVLPGLAYEPTALFRTLRVVTLDGSLNKTYNDSFWFGSSSFNLSNDQSYMVFQGGTSNSNINKIKKGMIVTFAGQEGSAVVTDINLSYKFDDVSTPAYFPTIWIDGEFPGLTNLAGAVNFRDNEAEPSDTWNSYKSQTPLENNNDDYIDDHYWRANGERYGLDPQHAQANGSFYIDQVTGKIHFSSNISGKTVILDYISDSLGTDAEMQVHKFAEEAMYKCIAYAILSTSIYGQQLVPRFKKEKFAAIRQAKLRLSNIKLEELTQILRGKSKHIKH